VQLLEAPLDALTLSQTSSPARGGARRPVAQRLGLEWLVRVGHEPRRLAWHKIDGNSRFVHRMLREIVRTLLRRQAQPDTRP